MLCLVLYWVKGFRGYLGFIIISVDGFRGGVEVGSNFGE